MSLQARPNNTVCCILILFTVAILRVCSAAIFYENIKRTFEHSPAARNVIYTSKFIPPSEHPDFRNSEPSLYKFDRFRKRPAHFDSPWVKDNEYSNKIKYVATNSTAGRRFGKLGKRSEETEFENVTENLEEKEEEKPKEKDDDQEDEDDDDNDWSVKSDAKPVEGESNSKEAETNGISPVKGPYLNISGSKDKAIEDDENTGIQHNHAHLFKNWEGYLQAVKDVISKRFSNKHGEVRVKQKESSRKPAPQPVIHSDDHFRLIDKILKEKNERVKTFHDLVLYMQKQRKSFKIPKIPEEIQTTANPITGNKHDKRKGVKSTAKPISGNKHLKRKVMQSTTRPSKRLSHLI